MIRAAFFIGCALSLIGGASEFIALVVGGLAMWNGEYSKAAAAFAAATYIAVFAVSVRQIKHMGARR